MNKPVRLFFAVEVPEETRNEISKFGETLDRSWKPSRPEQLHITLAFMGAVLPDDIAKVIQIGEETAQKHSGFFVAISDTSVFPEFGEPRVLYAQVDGGKPLLALAQELRQHLADMADQKKIKPHLTLARSSGVRPARKVLRKFKGSWQITDFVLFKSISSPNGITHEPLQKFKLTVPVL